MMASFYVKYNNLLDKTIKYLGSPKEELREKWIGSLCTFNGILHFIVSIGLYLDKQKYIIKSSGEKKVAVLAVMNNKYRGPMYMALAIHIISGTISHLGSALSIYFENTKYSTLSTNLAIVSSAAELFFHAPTALYLTPFVYGDKGVAPFVYGLVSCLLALSGASALKEALIDKKEGDDNNNNNNNKNNSNSTNNKNNNTAVVAEKKPKRNVVVKVGMVGDAQIGKTTLMVKYVEGQFEEDYIETLGVNFMEKSITLKSTEVTFSIWDLGGQREFATMLPLVCNDAVAILFMFDLSNKSTLSSVKEWYRQVRGLNKDAFAILVGTKYDLYLKLSEKDQKEVTKQAKRYAKAMKAPLIFSSASHSVNVNKIFKILLAKVFGLKCNIPKITKQGDPICMVCD